MGVNISKFYTKPKTFNYWRRPTKDEIKFGYDPSCRTQKTFQRLVQASCSYPEYGSRKKIIENVYERDARTSGKKRLFGLRQKLNERYDDIPGMDLFRQQ